MNGVMSDSPYEDLVDRGGEDPVEERKNRRRRWIVEFPDENWQQICILLVSVGAALLALTALFYNKQKVDFDSPYYIAAASCIGAGAVIAGVVFSIVNRRTEILRSRFLRVSFCSADSM
jgi:peptidoglycan/LPS O-acetylase OafA/YrhL